MTPHYEAMRDAVAAYNSSDKRLRENKLDDAIRAYLAHMAAAGWKLTRREATAGMLAAGADDLAAAIWSDMHDAAPSPEEAP